MLQGRDPLVMVQQARCCGFVGKPQCHVTAMSLRISCWECCDADASLLLSPGSEPPPVLVLHGRYGGSVGDLAAYDLFTLGGPHSVLLHRRLYIRVYSHVMCRSECCLKSKCLSQKGLCPPEMVDRLPWMLASFCRACTTCGHSSPNFHSLG